MLGDRCIAIDFELGKEEKIRPGVAAFRIWVGKYH